MPRQMSECCNVSNWKGGLEEIMGVDMAIFGLFRARLKCLQKSVKFERVHNNRDLVLFGLINTVLI